MTAVPHHPESIPIASTAVNADIAIISEGAYPYIKGGVSSWVHQIIQAFPDYRFLIVFLGSHPDEYGAPCYQLPDNVVAFETGYLFSSIDPGSATVRVPNRAALNELKTLHQWFKSSGCPQGKAALASLYEQLDSIEGFNVHQFLQSEDAWAYITEMYQQYCTDPSFSEYFWTIRNMHLPLWPIANLARRVPPVKCIHAVSTGYAGFLASLIKQRLGCPLVLSEHGIYTKERRIDLLQSRMFNDDNPLTRMSKDMSYQRRLWIRFFESLARICYQYADPIISLYTQANAKQIADGADPNKTRVIANGISIDTFRHLRREQVRDHEPVVALIGRVVPIKDIKTLIMAMMTVIKKIPSCQCWMVGPTTEDPDYYEACQRLVSNLELESYITFKGTQQLSDILPKIDLTVLSSISEGMPLTILESYAAGVPVVATDVGSCRELILGRDGDDQAIGPGGRVVTIANPQALADAIVALLSNATDWRNAQHNAITRVERYYTQSLMIDQYREIYQQALAQWQG